MQHSGKVSFVATPIGNLEDITLRALRTLKEADVIYAEDTRVTRKLLEHYSITTPLASFHQHSGEKTYEKILEQAMAGQALAIVTDAGTPGISDPGVRLVAFLVGHSGGTLKIEPIPGASALTTILSVAGLSTDEFQFLGFIPTKKGRETMLMRLANAVITTIVYESSHRIMKTITWLEAQCPDRPIVVGRELTKLHETLYRGTVSEVAAMMREDSTYAQKGEFVIVL